MIKLNMQRLIAISCMRNLKRTFELSFVKNTQQLDNLASDQGYC